MVALASTMNPVINVLTWLQMMSLCLQPVNHRSCTGWVLGFQQKFVKSILIVRVYYNPPWGVPVRHLAQPD
jgi:hypothetical protein